MNEVEKLSINDYRDYIEQEMNLGNLYRQGEFQLMTSSELSKQTLLEYKAAKKRGRVNG